MKLMFNLEFLVGKETNPHMKHKDKLHDS